MELLKVSTPFQFFYSQLLKFSEFDAFFWENKPYSIDDLNTPYEFVLVNSNRLISIQADSVPFKKYFNQQDVVSFPNLGGDAVLIVPCPLQNNSTYAHFAVFIRNASQRQLNSFWKCVATNYLEQSSPSKKWLSTAGLGVSWLHVRIDQSPKYYRFSEYKEESISNKRTSSLQ